MTLPVPDRDSVAQAKAVLDRLERGEVPSHLPSVLGDEVAKQIPGDAVVSVRFEYPDRRPGRRKGGSVVSRIEFVGADDRRRTLNVEAGKVVSDDVV